MGFPHISVGKESACNAGDPSSIPGTGRSTGERIGYSLQYSWASLVAQLIKNPPAMRETWVSSLGWEDPLEKGKGTQSTILAWRIPWTKSMGSQGVGHDWATFTFTVLLGLILCPWTWGLLLSLSYWGLSFALGRGVSFFGGIQLSPVDGCSAVSCSFGVLKGEDERTSFFSIILCRGKKKSYSQSCGFSSSHVWMWELDH